MHESHVNIIIITQNKNSETKAEYTRWPIEMRRTHGLIRENGLMIIQSTHKSNEPS